MSRIARGFSVVALEESNHGACEDAGADSSLSGAAEWPKLAMRWISESGRLRADWTAAQEDSADVRECQLV